jgi:hypothetical protein
VALIILEVLQLAYAIANTGPTVTILEKYRYAVDINPIVITTNIIVAMMVDIPFFIFLTSKYFPH